MIRKLFAASRTYILTLFAAALGSVALSAQAPNIVIFEPDDLDNVTFQTALEQGLLPNIQTYLLSQGLYFQNYYVSDSRGCPTREAYMNGKYFHNIVPNASNHQCGLFQFDDKNTLAVWLHNSGYTTSLIGKYMDGYGYEDANGDGKVDQSDANYIPPGWDNWESIPYYAPVANGITPPAGTILTNDNPNEYNYYLTTNGVLSYRRAASTDYQVDVLSNAAVAYINNVSTAQPLFMMVTPGAPHIETNYTQTPPLAGYESEWSWDVRPPARYVGSVNVPLPQPPNFNPPNLTGKPQWLLSKPLMTEQDIADDTVQWNDRLAALRAVDDLVGNVVQALTARGMAQNTIFMFFSDNGWMYGNWRLGGKLAAYDPSIGVPLIVSDGIAAGTSTNAMVIANDIPATILEMAGVTAPSTMDGTSFKPVLDNPAIPWRNRFLVEHWQAIGGAQSYWDCPNYKATRTSNGNPALPNQLYVLYPTTAETEFYDYTTDPYAMTNLNTDPTRLKQMQQQKQAAVQMASCSGTTCHTLEFQ